MDEAIMLGDHHSRLIAKMMEFAQQRQQLIAHNLSNANTPNFIRRDADFTKQLAEIVRSGATQGLDSIRIEPAEDHTLPARLDGNNVQIPVEMNEMMQNGLMYELLAKAFSARTTILKMAIQGGPN